MKEKGFQIFRAVCLVTVFLLGTMVLMDVFTNGSNF